VAISVSTLQQCPVCTLQLPIAMKNTGSDSCHASSIKMSSSLVVAAAARGRHAVPMAMLAHSSLMHSMPLFSSKPTRCGCLSSVSLSGTARSHELKWDWLAFLALQIPSLQLKLLLCWLNKYEPCNCNGGAEESDHRIYHRGLAFPREIVRYIFRPYTNICIGTAGINLASTFSSRPRRRQMVSTAPPTLPASSMSLLQHVLCCHKKAQEVGPDQISPKIPW
jgi:hypothetical protein